MKLAVTLLLFRPPKEGITNTQVLSISRGKNLEDWGLVGGKVEDGETLKVAIIREVQEESNVVIHGSYMDDLIPVYTGIAQTRLTTTFLATEFKLPKVFPHTLEGKVAWMPPHFLVSPRCTYHEYNQKLFDHLRISTEFDGHPEEFPKLLP